MTPEQLDDAMSLKHRIENCKDIERELKHAINSNITKIAPITFLEQNKPLYNKLNNVVEEYRKQLEEQFKNL